MIYIDEAGHMISSVSLEELHEFALSIGLKRHYYGGVRKGHPHYDLVTVFRKKKALDNGAILVSPKKLIEISRRMT